MWIRGTLIAAAAAALLWLVLYLSASQPPQATAAATPGQASGAAVSAPQQAQFPPPAAWGDPLAIPDTGPAVSPLSTMTPAQFSADSRGRLVLNADTHANLEKLLIEENPDALRAGLERSANKLPPQAAAELQVLAAKFQQYSKALSHSISPEQAPQNEQEGLKLLNDLHSLRVSYLGAEATQAMFGEEEATTRRLLALMQANKDPGLTFEQKAERAQESLNGDGIKATPAG
jgi:hypothetical protein